MGRIEYEYPLFKVYYSNIRGNPAAWSCECDQEVVSHNQDRAVLYCTVLCCTGPGAPYDRLGCVCPPVQDTFNWHKCDQLKIKYILNSLGSWFDNYDHWCLVLQ